MAATVSERLSGSMEPRYRRLRAVAPVRDQAYSFDMAKFLAGLTALLLIAPIAIAGPTPVIDIDLSRKKDGPWNTSFFRQNVGQETEDVFLRVINRDTN